MILEFIYLWMSHRGFPKSSIWCWNVPRT